MKRWKPTYNGEYYYVGEQGEIERYMWFNDEIDNKLCAFGNCFRTRRESQAALRRVKAALKGER